ncbi:helix-turn-helix transcriptional regulator [Corynebacterium sp. AOP12-C2-36]|uniref:helix-turn-helix transcriptional regulator n=1 Tax=Corynebacterium sp. AOP12-C2-36 TaxID=3457723 RepID=UPI0040335E85
MNVTITDADTGQELWTAGQCCEHTGVSRRTWSAYVAREQAPSPVGHLDRMSLWDAETVRSWHAARPGRTTRKETA